MHFSDSAEKKIAKLSGLSVQDGIDEAGSPINLLWKPNAQAVKVPVVPPEYVGWRQEESAWQNGALLYDLSHHMTDLFLEGPDALRLLTWLSANDMENFAIGQAKQMIPVTARGHLVQDTVLMRTGLDSFLLTGVVPAQHWVTYHAEAGGYDVRWKIDPNSAQREGGAPPPMFRYQIQGRTAMQVMERVLGSSPPDLKFFHSAEVEIAGRKVRAFRHGMLGQPGFELLGDWKDNDAVVEAILAAGEPFGLVRCGGLAYFLNGIEGGWIPTPTPAIYTDPELESYRRYRPLLSFEGQMPIHGSFFSENIEDYYVSPYELGYGRLIKFNHDFLGREALEKSKDAIRRTNVTLVLNEQDVRLMLGDNPEHMVRHARDRIEVAGEMVGIAMYEGYLPSHNTILALSIIDKRYASPGTEVEIVWGEHPGPGTAPDAHKDFPRIRARVEPAPYNAYARTEYRR